MQAEFSQTVGALVTRLAATPAIVVNNVGDILHTNVLAQDLFSEFTIRDNLARMIFLDAAAKCCASAWHAHARDTVAGLRQAYRHSSDDRATDRLISELIRSSTQFHAMWMQPDGAPPDRTPRVFPHREMGPLVVDEVVLISAAEPGTTVVVYAPTPGSASDDALRILGALRASGRSDSSRFSLTLPGSG